MDDLKSKYKYSLSQTNNLKNGQFSSYIPDNKNINKQYNGFTSSPKIEEEYQKIINNKNNIKKSSIINITSEELKKEYLKKLNYYNKGLNYIFIISILLIISTFIEIKFLIPSESKIIILIMGCISAGLTFMLLVNITGLVS